MKEKVDEVNDSEAQNVEPICDENYDDLDTVKEQALQLQNGMWIFNIEVTLSHFCFTS